MRFDVADQAFRETAERWLASLSDDTIVDLQAVFAVSPGYYPTTLHELWQEEISRRGLASRSRPRNAALPGRRTPVSHPHDCDWRFTAESTQDLLQRATDGLATDACVAHLGAPSTFALGVKTRLDLRHVLLERNPAMTAALETPGRESGARVICVDLLQDDVPSLGAAAAIIDPPWYPGETLAFLAAAARVCGDGALLWLCQPTLATRPGVTDERALIVAELPQLGLTTEATHAATVRYNMPHFEAMSIRLASLDPPVPRTWRTGDLLVLRKVSEAPPLPPATLGSERWQEVSFGLVRIKLRPSDTDNDLASIVPGDVLHTVSRRDPVRARIGLWTSGNRVYALADPEPVGKLIELCDIDLGNMQFTFARTLAHARRLGMSRSTAQRLFDVLLLELQEHSASEGP